MGSAETESLTGTFTQAEQHMSANKFARKLNNSNTPEV
jgi:hypothetical protein